MEEPNPRIRLHITPFNPTLLDRYIPASLKPQASNISFHAVETFPERGFGYVELPTSEAQKLKAKLNGMTLKGAKVKIEEARPEKKRKNSDEVGESVAEEKPRKKSKKEKSKDRGDGVLPGHELQEGRHVKRGWAEETAGKSKTGKKDKEGKKLKFKTAVEENKVVIVDEGKEKKDQKEQKEKKEKSKHGHKKEVVVTEFAKSTKLNFPNVKGARKDLTYEEGQGWVDQEGNVVEAEPPSKKRKRSKVAKEPKSAPAEEPVEEPLQVTTKPVDIEMKESGALSPNGSIASSDFSASEEEQSDSTVMSSSSSDTSSVDEETTRHLDQATSNTLVNSGVQDAPSTIIHSLTAKRSTEQTPPTETKEIHPLEALFKRAPPTSNAVPEPTTAAPSFGFFGNDDNDSDDDAMHLDIAAANAPAPLLTALQAPQTPHTKRDLEWRSIRSAAPTPDTAAIGKRFEFPPVVNGYDDDDEEKEDDEGEQGVREDGVKDGAKDAGREGESEFRSWFYQNRGDLNRAWKKRRKEERKVERQRENRRVGRRMA